MTINTMLCALCIAVVVFSISQISAQPQPPGVASEKTTATAEADDYHLFKPIVWGCNDEFKLQIGGETRIRAEWQNNWDLDYSKGKDDNFGLLRTLVNFDLTYNEVVRAYVEILDGREFATEREMGQEDHVDLHQAFLDFRQPAKGPWTLRLGRQEIDLGRDRRLVESSNWSNLRRAYDGGRLMYRTPELDADLFITHPLNYNYRRGDETLTGHAGPRTEEWFYGGYLTSRHFAPHTLETYFLAFTDTDEHRTFSPNRKSEDGTYGSENRYTVGSVLYGPLYEDTRGTLSYTGEGAYQFGRYSKDDIHSFFLRGDITYKWKRKWSPSLGLVGTLASGDDNPDDGENGSFDRLFGANHGPYGIMDFVTARNLRELALVGKIEPTKKLRFQAEAHSYWMESKTDTGLAPPRHKAYRDKTGQSGSEVGQEISIFGEYDYSKRLSLEAGAAHFFPGTFTQAQGGKDGANLFYLQARYRF